MIVRSIENIGRSVIDFVSFVGAIGLLMARATLSGRVLVGPRRARRMALAGVFAQMVRVGVRSIGIVSLVVFCIGVILTLQIVPILETYGAKEQIARVIGVSMFRELGPLVGAIVLTGFAGASIAAEIGTMAVSEEIEALQTHAIDPIRFLVMPRVLATSVMTVCLAVVADCLGVLGGLLSAWIIADIAPQYYLSLTFASVTVQDFVTGLFKASIFGAVIALLACHLGLKTRNGAVGVGEATTRTVVLTVVALTFIDLLFTAIFYRLGW